MFKYVICRGLEDILIVFNTAKAVPVSTMRGSIDQANAHAAPIWNDEGKSFAVRSAECKAILRPVLKQNKFGDDGIFNPFPLSAATTLDEIFRKHYQPSTYLFMGRADKDALNLQDAYAREAGRALGLLRGSYESRTITSIGMAYGRTSIPFLCMSSVSALWETCQTLFYTRQLSLVSSACQYTGKFTDSRPSFINGSSHSQSR